MLHELLKDTKIVLASGSPRRKELLSLVGLKFRQVVAHVDETIIPSDYPHPKRYVRKIATRKCVSVKNALKEDCLVVAADTVVFADKKILLKPADLAEATSFLNILSGKRHTVYTGIALSFRGQVLSDTAKTHVTFRTLSDTEIADYLKTGESLDKAGGYGIQGYGSQFIEHIDGCYFNVMGFPLNLFLEMIYKLRI